VTHAQDAYLIASDAVSDYVRVDDRQFAQRRTWHGPTAIGKGHQVVTCGKQRFGQSCRSPRVELRDVSLDFADFSSAAGDQITCTEAQ
jgi:hypothetical protein